MAPVSSQRFFAIQELVDQLALQLGRADLFRLSRTNRTIHARCSPALFQILNDSSVSSIFNSIPSTLALARNISYVKELTLGPEELAYYYICVQAFEKFKAQTAGTHPATRPCWFSPLDPQTCQVIPLPPVTHLSWFSMVSYSSHDNLYKISGSDDLPARLAGLGWLLSLNPFLTRLGVYSLNINSPRMHRLLVSTITNLTNIKDLNVSIVCPRQNGDQLGIDLLHCIQPSIQKFRFVCYGSNVPWEQDLLEDEFEDLEVLRKQKPLLNLVDLYLWNLDSQTLITDFLSIFPRCPNIDKLTLSGISGHRNLDIIGRAIGKECPKLRILDSHLEVIRPNDLLLYSIMKALPPQQVTNLDDMGMYCDLSHSTTISAIQQHSTTLSTISLGRREGCSRISSTIIFDSCINLEVLIIDPNDGELYIDLADVQGSPWRCTKLRNLTLGIHGCELPVDALEPPYYDRPAPIVLSQAEIYHFSQLEGLYIQIGRLKELRRLNMTMVVVGEQGLVMERWDNPRLFPAMLSLGNTQEGRPGFLKHLVGLTKLTSLLGSVCMDTEETETTVGWREVTWMDEHWPELQYAAFFDDERDVRAPFSWLKDQRKHGRAKLNILNN